MDGKIAPSKHILGGVPDNHFGTARIPGGLRLERAKRGWVQVRKPLSPDFNLAMKHPAAFTALLPELATRISCYAIVRNPLAALASWNS